MTMTLTYVTQYSNNSNPVHYVPEQAPLCPVSKQKFCIAILVFSSRPFRVGLTERFKGEETKEKGRICDKKLVFRDRLQWPSCLSRHVSNSSRDRCLGPRFESHSRHECSLNSSVSKPLLSYSLVLGHLSRQLHSKLRKGIRAYQLIQTAPGLFLGQLAKDLFQGIIHQTPRTNIIKLSSLVIHLEPGHLTKPGLSRISNYYCTVVSIIKIRIISRFIGTCEIIFVS